MSLGPFITYVPPNVYTRTLTEANVANIVAGLRIPFVIGVVYFDYATAAFVPHCALVANLGRHLGSGAGRCTSGAVRGPCLVWLAPRVGGGGTC